MTLFFGTNSFSVGKMVASFMQRSVVAFMSREAKVTGSWFDSIDALTKLLLRVIYQRFSWWNLKRLNSNQPFVLDWSRKIALPRVAGQITGRTSPELLCIWMRILFLSLDTIQVHIGTTNNGGESRGGVAFLDYSDKFSYILLPHINFPLVTLTSLAYLNEVFLSVKTDSCLFN